MAPQGDPDPPRPPGSGSNGVPPPTPEAVDSSSQGITVEVRDLTYAVPVTTPTASSTKAAHADTDTGGGCLARGLRRLWPRRPRPKALLRRVSFAARPGRMTYIMGGSGAGEWAMLHVNTRACFGAFKFCWLDGGANAWTHPNPPPPSNPQNQQLPGKSTLLDLLAHRPQSPGWLAGGVFYNGVPQPQAWARVEPHMAYVRQVRFCSVGCGLFGGELGLRSFNR